MALARSTKTKKNKPMRTLSLHATYERTCSTNQTFNPSEVTSLGYEHDGSSMSRHDDGFNVIWKSLGSQGTNQPPTNLFKSVPFEGTMSETWHFANIWPAEHSGKLLLYLASQAFIFSLALFLFGQLWRKRLRKGYLGAFGRRRGCHQWTRRSKGKWTGLVVDPGSKEEHQYDQVGPSNWTLEARTNF